MKVLKGLLLTAVLALSACVGIKTEVDDISQLAEANYQRYGWATKAMSAQGGRSQFAVDVDNAIRAAVDAKLAAKGYQKVANEQAQFLVSYRFSRKVSVDEGDRMATPKALQGAFDVGAGMGDPGMSHGFVPESISENILRFSARDAESKKELWHATASKVVENNEKNPEKIRRATDKVADKLFSVFPRLN